VNIITERIEASTTDIRQRTKLSHYTKGECSKEGVKVSNHASCLKRGNLTIKQHINTPLVPPALIVVAPKHVLVSHRLHRFIVNVQPTFPTTAVSVRVEHVDRIVPTTCGLAVVIEHPIQLVVDLLRRFSCNRCHDF
jgi:hypothetical protein